MKKAQGRRFSEKEIETIKTLLATSDLAIGDIAKRMGCSSGAIAAINRRMKIRIYNRKRSSWMVNEEFKTEA